MVRRRRTKSGKIKCPKGTRRKRVGRRIVCSRK